MHAFLFLTQRFFLENLIIDLAVNIVNVVFGDITLGSEFKETIEGELLVLFLLLIEFEEKAVGSTDCFINVSEYISRDQKEVLQTERSEPFNHQNTV